MQMVQPLHYNQSNESFQLRQMSFDDLQWVWKTRNQNSVRAQAVNDSIISWDSHRKWWESDQAVDKLIFTIDQEPQGVVTRTAQNFWSFYLSEETPKNQGIAMIMLSLYLRQYRLRGGLRLKAHVRMDNFPSQRLHKKLGFRLSSTNYDMRIYNYTLKVEPRK